MDAVIAVLPGDGIGPEISVAAVSVLDAVADTFGHSFECSEYAIGGAAIDATGDPLPDETRKACLAADAVLLGAVGDPRWSHPSASVRPEQGLLALRKAMGVYANLRPITPIRRVAGASPLRPELLDGVDICFVRELTGGIYFGEKWRESGTATDVCTYAEEEIVRVVRLACRLAGQRSGRVTSVDKANVLETSRLWREVAERVAREEFPEITLEHALVDAAAMQLLQNPRGYDVVVTENMFGDILTDGASVLAGSIGLLPSASLADSGPGLYEPIHGSAPDLRGRGVANPCGAILSVAMLLRHSLGLEREAKAVETAVASALRQGVRTPDVAGPGPAAASTTEMAHAVCRWVTGEEPGRAIA
jgi:3-isopropylmalate dehydrogenase